MYVWVDPAPYLMMYNPRALNFIPRWYGTNNDGRIAGYDGFRSISMRPQNMTTIGTRPPAKISSYKDGIRAPSGPAVIPPRSIAPPPENLPRPNALLGGASPDASQVPMPTRLTPPNTSAIPSAESRSGTATNAVIQEGQTIKEAAIDAAGPEAMIAQQLANASTAAIGSYFDNSAATATKEQYDKDSNMRTPLSRMVAERRATDSTFASNRASTFRNVGSLFGGPIGALLGQGISKLTSTPKSEYKVLATPDGFVDPTRVTSADSDNMFSFSQPT